jgi:hypothetical protein
VGRSKQKEEVMSKFICVECNLPVFALDENGGVVTHSAYAPGSGVGVDQPHEMRDCPGSGKKPKPASSYIMPTIANMPGADLPVQFPSGATKKVNMIVLLAEVLNAEHRAKYGHHLAPNAPTISKLREKYGLDYFFDGSVRTWKDCALTMRYFYNVCNERTHQGAHVMSGWGEFHDYDFDDVDDDRSMFADSDGESALRAETADNPRDRPCPTCGGEDLLTPADAARGYQCDSCARRAEGTYMGGDY